MVFFTICSRNFLGYAQALQEGIRAHHRDARFVLVLCDEPHGIDTESYPFRVLTIGALGMPDWDQMASRYNITELNTSVKPFAFLRLFDDYPTEPIVYLDPDILIASRLEELYECFAEGAECVLTPHLLEPAEFSEMHDLRILRFGVYNLGFCGLVGSWQVRRVVSWWARRLEGQCVIDLAQGLFVDQRWADLFPAYIERTKVLRHPGYNVAYWNLSQRRVRRVGSEWTVNGRPLRFFHFSGNVIEDERVFARHSAEFTVDNIGDVAVLMGEYRRHVRACGHGYYRAFPFAYRWSGARGHNEHTPESVAVGRIQEGAAPHLPLMRAQSLSEFESWRSSMAGVLADRRQVEARLVPLDRQTFTLQGYCACCGKESVFQVSDMYSVERLPDGRPFPNWREHLNCLSCGLVNRIRAAFHLLTQELKPQFMDRIYITEQKTANFRWLSDRFARVDGSEFFGGEHKPGALVDGVRHEDLQNLSFRSESHDFVLSFDVLEHVPDYGRALREIYRCLRKGGVLLFTVPFRWDKQEHEVRARLLDSGETEHLLEPEYHGNPVDMEHGSLCYRYFGWAVLDELRAIGFEDVAVWSYWSRHFAYLGDPQGLLVARK